MNAFLSDGTARWFLTELSRMTLLVAVCGAAAWLMLRLARISSPALHRACCLAVLLAGWTFVRWPVDVVWYEAVPVVEQTESPAEAPQSFSPPIDPALLSPPLEIGAGMSFPPTDLAASPQAEQLDPSRSAPVDELPTRWQIPWLPLAVAAWLVGIVAIAATWIAGYLRFLQNFPSEVGCAPEWSAEFTAVCAEHDGVARVALRVTDSAGPLLCRIPRGAVLLVPRSMWIALAPHERRAILRHELEHYRRGDLWKSLAMRVLALPHWFNPVAWLAVRRFDDAAEWACDLAAMGAEPTTYAAMLLRLGELASTPARFGSAMSNRPLTTRIKRLLTLTTAEDSAMKKAALISLLLLVLPLTLVRVNLVAEEPEADPPQQPADVASPPAGAPLASELPADDQVFAAEPTAKPPRNTPPDNPVRAAQRKMVEMAKTTYDAQLAAHQGGTITLDPVFLWSNLWLSAELAVSESREAQLAAAQSHLNRMKAVEVNIRPLFETGSRGGEANNMYAASYYVADAERRLAEIEAMPQPAAQTTPARIDRSMAEAARRAFDATNQAYHAGNATLEALIGWSFKWLAAELTVASSREEQLAAARANVNRIRKLHTEISALFTTGSRGGEAQLMATADYYLADAERRLFEIEDLPQQQRSAAVQQPLAPPSLAAEERKPRSARDQNAAPRAQSSPAKIDKRPRYYNAKTFEQWRDQLQTDLSPVLRKEAMYAMAEFAAHGYGQEAGTVIFDTASNYSATPTTNSLENEIQKAALYAATRVPAGELLPLIEKALESDDPNERLFAIQVVPLEHAPPGIVELLEKAMDDEDPQVARQARGFLSRANRSSAKLMDWLRQSLAKGDSDAMALVLDDEWRTPLGRPFDRQPYHELLPELVALLDHPDQAVRERVKFLLKNNRDGKLRAALEEEANRSGPLRELLQPTDR